MTTGPEGPAAPDQPEGVGRLGRQLEPDLGRLRRHRELVRAGGQLARRAELLRRPRAVRFAGHGRRRGRPVVGPPARPGLPRFRRPAGARAAVPDRGHGRAGAGRDAVGPQRLRLQLDAAGGRRHQPVGQQSAADRDRQHERHHRHGPVRVRPGPRPRWGGRPADLPAALRRPGRQHPGPDDRRVGAARRRAAGPALPGAGRGHPAAAPGGRRHRRARRRRPDHRAVAGRAGDQPGSATTGSSSGTLSVRFDFPTGTDVRGETFDLVNSALVCGQTSQDLNRADVAPGQTADLRRHRPVHLQRRLHGRASSCSRTRPGPPTHRCSAPATRGIGTGSVSIPLPSATDARPSDFNAAVERRRRTTPRSSSPTTATTASTCRRGWTITATNGTTTCGTAHDQPAAGDARRRHRLHQGRRTVHRVGRLHVPAGTRQHFDGIAVSGTAPQPVDPSQGQLHRGVEQRRRTTRPST